MVWRFMLAAQWEMKLRYRVELLVQVLYLLGEGADA
jgi:hypothetical protein